MIKPIKKLGQNFLVDKKISEKLVSYLCVESGDTIIEIGPGKGALTSILVSKSPLESKIIAVEIDERFIRLLNLKFTPKTNVKIVHANILDYLPTFKCEKKLKIIGALPYYITSPILHSVIKMNPQPEIAVFVVQKEVGEKVANIKNKMNYLAAFIQAFYDVTYLGVIKKEKFDPVPSVDSAIIKLTKNEVHLTHSDINEYEDFLHSKFKHPKKMINKVFTKEELSEYSVSGELRPHEIDIKTWLNLFRASK